MKQKQKLIVEMAKDICRVKLNCNDACHPISACDALKYAERAVEAGYSKQREGEWRSTGVYGFEFQMFKCSHCGKRTEDGNGLPYCPQCGAKMKSKWRNNRNDQTDHS